MLSTYELYQELSAAADVIADDDPTITPADLETIKSFLASAQYDRETLLELWYSLHFEYLDTANLMPC